ncbi:unnamed protein product [Somion occarium]|uniref:NADP-dependent oxidoreductase domain-containing protein n=1 Tax=Somion occarium TaxID=3059160 RepID=A0ABP1DIW7_9APHY
MSTPIKKMPYVQLGKSGLKVSKIILGCGSYGSSQWADWVIEDEQEAFKHIKFAYDHGIQTFDTADMYSNGQSEIILGKAIRELQLPRDELVIMTKVFFPVGKNHTTGLNPDEIGLVNQYGLSRKVRCFSVSSFLERLQLDYVEVLQWKFDLNTPIEETMQALHDVVKTGYARYIGMSSCYAYQFHAMQNYAISHNLTPFISMQNHYNLVYREEEREMFPTLKLFGVGAIPWSPLARGFLTRPLSVSTKRSETDKYAQQLSTIRDLDGPSVDTQDIVNRVEELAKKKGVTMAQIGTAWILAKDGVTAPIVGSTNLKNLEDLVAAVHISLSEDKFLEEAYKPSAVLGHT